MNATFPDQVQQCADELISWSGGVPSYTLTILPLVPHISIPPQTYTNIQDESFSWVANVTVGTTVRFNVSDSTGESTESSSLASVTPGSTGCMPSWGSLPLPPWMSSTDQSSPTAAPQTAGPDTSLSARAIGGIAAAGGVALLSLAALAVLLFRRICRRRRSPGPIVDLDEPPRFAGTPTTPWRDAIAQPRPVVLSYASSTKPLSRTSSTLTTREYEFGRPDPNIAMLNLRSRARSPEESDLEHLHRLQYVPYASDIVGGPDEPVVIALESPRRRKRVRTRTMSSALSLVGQTPTVTEEVIEEGTDSHGHHTTDTQHGTHEDVPASPIQERDGGVRLAGGPVRHVFVDDRINRDSDSPVPPPYHPY